MVYTDPALLEALPEGEFDRMMRGCLQKADDMQASGKLLDFQQLELPSTARSVRTRSGRWPSSTARSPRPRKSSPAST